MSLDGEVTLDYAASGLVWGVTCPTGRITGHADHGSAGAAAADVTPPPRLTAIGRVLVVEDEALVALEIASALSEAGYEVVGPASSVGRALDLIQRLGCDVAVLDINLGAETAEPIAEALARAGKPFLTISGYAPRQRPASFADAPHLGKPLRPEVLVAEVTRCLRRAAA